MVFYFNLFRFTPKMDNFDQSCLNEMLPRYYKRLFPFKLFCNWLEYDEISTFQNREFAFVLAGDKYLRFRSFNNRVEFEKDVQHLNPQKIEIGAIYNYRPKDGRGKQDFAPVEHELVFDIDLTDYDDIRKCCSDTSMCKKCWRFIRIAVGVIDGALDEDFGFDHRMWVYSGRRGIHCWVCDPKARKLTAEDRSAIVDYLTLISAKKISLPNGYIHPSTQRSVDVILKHFPALADEQNWFEDEESYKPFLDLLASHEGLKKALELDLRNRDTGLSRAEAIVLRLEKNGYENDNKPLTEAVLQFGYPRLDINVSKGLNHLLKSPFCVHPKTGKVCVPLDMSIIDQFDPDVVPRLDLLCQELIDMHSSAIEAMDSSPNNRKQLDYKRTSLAPYVEIFEDFVQGLHKAAECDTSIAQAQSDSTTVSISV